MRFRIEAKFFIALMDKCSNKKSKRSNSKFKILNELVYGKN